jgi:hypothetical protein
MTTRRVHELGFADATARFDKGTLVIEVDERHPSDFGIQLGEIKPLEDFVRSSTEITGLQLCGRNTCIRGLVYPISRNQRITKLVALRQSDEPGFVTGTIMFLLSMCPRLRMLEWRSDSSTIHTSDLSQSFIDAIATSTLRRFGLSVPSLRLAGSQMCEIIARNRTIEILEVHDVRCDVQLLINVINDNWTLQHLMGEMLYLGQGDRMTIWKLTARNQRNAWPFQHRALLDVCIAFSSLRLSSYVLLEIVSWLIERPGPDPHRLRRLRLIDGVARASPNDSP